MSRADGFTLLELLVALAIFSVIALVAWRGLDSVATTKLRLDAEAQSWRELSLVFDRIGDDLGQSLRRSWRDGEGRLQPAFGGRDAASAPALEFVRFARDRDPQRVAYRLDGNTLALQLWDVLDAAPDAKPATLPLLDDIGTFSAAFLDAGGTWQTHWPAGASAAAEAPLPRAVKVTLARVGSAPIERVFALP
ncbi:type II secretion system minor pseudopilin GspJ [Jeongeupia sp. USM3]|uniref:type II secretion system minor pseudopilin GspJ n=1 Tax=Jeongeupia sp. USM3 TaxID=1906741 RepID=UPI00089DF793|nr:type II secretion system minor pseudopilin GspJ [Jeongeupia sp. USM3]AOX99552.1 type II secretion system protein GspJ [Jeongeupia sp. USM3]